MKPTRFAILLIPVFLFESVTTFAAGPKISFAPAINISSGGKEPSSLVTADFNGDGKMDVAVTNRADNTVAVLLGNGDGSFQDPVTYVVGSGLSFPISLVAGDFNRDGFQDLAVANALVGLDGGTIGILLGNGDGSFQSPIPYDTQVSPISLAVGDLNGDGFLDIVVGGNGSGRVMLGNGDGSFRLGVSFQNGTTASPSPWLTSAPMGSSIWLPQVSPMNPSPSPLATVMATSVSKASFPQACLPFQ